MNRSSMAAKCPADLIRALGTWSVALTLVLSAAAQAKCVDSDNDGLSDDDENVIGTNPDDPDSDDDGLNDGPEHLAFHTDPLDFDTDDDGLSDGTEVNATFSNPLLHDTDADGLDDGPEVNDFNTSPTDQDTDDDMIDDWGEVSDIGTNPISFDTDSDGASDGQEVQDAGSSPLVDDQTGTPEPVEEGGGPEPEIPPLPGFPDDPPWWWPPELRNLFRNKGGGADGSNPSDGSTDERADPTAPMPGYEGAPDPNPDHPPDPPEGADGYSEPRSDGYSLNTKGPLGKRIGPNLGGGLGSSLANLQGPSGLNWSFQGNGMSIQSLQPQLYYNSRIEFDGPYGQGWDFTLNQHVVQGQGGDLIWSTGEGRTLAFSSIGEGQYESAAGHLMLTDWGAMSSPRYGINDPYGTWHDFNGNGQLVAIRDRWDRSMSLQYDTSQRLSSATDARGNVMDFLYYDSGRLKAIDDFAGRRTVFVYDANGNLREMGYYDPESDDTRYRQYNYTSGNSDERLNHNLVSVTDFQGNAEYTKTYGTSGDELDRVTSSQTPMGRQYLHEYTGTFGEDWTTTISLGETPLYDYHFADGELVDEGRFVSVPGQGTVREETQLEYSAAGEVTAVVLPDGRRTEYTYDEAGNLVEQRVKTTNTTIDSEDDLVQTIEYESTWNQIVGVTDPNGVTTTFEYDSTGLLVEVNRPIGTSEVATTQYSWNGNAQLTGVIDPDGVETEYTYNATGGNRGLLAGVARDPEGENIAVSLDRAATGEITGVTDAGGNHTTADFDGWGRLQSSTSPESLGYEVAYERDENLFPTRMSVKNVDGDGNVDSALPWIRTDTAFDAAGRLTSVTEDIDAETTKTRSWTYTDRDFVDTMTQPEGNQVHYDYEEHGFLSSVTVAPGTGDEGTWSYSYNSVKQLTRVEDPRGKAWAYEYDDYGRLATVTNPIGSKVVSVYDKAGRTLETRLEDDEEELLAKTEFVRDLAGRVIQVKKHEFGPGLDPATRTTTITRLPSGKISSIEYPDGLTVTRAYDSAGRLTEVTDPLGNQARYVYDSAGRIGRKESVQVEGQTTKTYALEYEYDAIGRVVQKSRIDADDEEHVVTFQYKFDSRGHVTEVSGGGGPTKEFVYDGAGRMLQSRTDPDGLDQVIALEFDRNDRVVGYADPNENVTTYEYNERNAVTEITYPGSQVASYAYDDAGNIASVTDPLGTVIESTFDDANRLTRRDITRATGVGGATFEDFVWDAMGRLVEARNDFSIVQYAYDSLGRVLSETQSENPVGATGKAVSYTYTEAGDVASVAYPSGITLEMGRDSLRRLTSVAVAGGDTLAEMAYIGSGRLSGVTFGNDAETGYQWDGLGRLSGLVHSAPGNSGFYDVDFLRRDDGAILAEVRNHDSGAGDVYRYHPDGKLAAVLYGVPDPAAELGTPDSEPFDSKTEYEFDAAGSRTEVTVTPGGSGTPVTTSYEVNSRNEYVTVGSASRTYDAAGNLSSTPTTDYAYDFRNHLVSADEGETNLGTYVYDAMGRRAWRTTAAGTTRYVYSGQDVLETYDDEDGLTARYSYLSSPDGRFSFEAPDWADVDDDSNTTEWLRFYYHKDVRGSVTHVTGPDGSIVESYSYDIYGTVTVFDQGEQQVSTSAIRNPFLYTGREWDGETGLYHYRARAYDPQTGSFLQRDPMRYALGPNLHQYVNADPVNFTDPFGLEPVPDGKQPKDDDEPPHPPHEDGLLAEAMDESIGTTAADDEGWGEVGDDADPLDPFDGDMALGSGPAVDEAPQLGTSDDSYEQYKRNGQLGEDITHFTAQNDENTFWPVVALATAEAAGWAAAILPEFAGGTGAASGGGAGAETTTVTHFTSEAIAAEIEAGGGVVNAGSFVTTPGQVAGMSQAGVETALELVAGKGAMYATFETAATNLAVPAAGALTSGGAIQYILKNPTAVGRFLRWP